jgi:peptidoglycan/LPS O-acetylase OafA/YrhL
MKHLIAQSASDRSIPSLDGLRAVSVACVILGHSQSKALDALVLLEPFRHGETGVSIFFVISGFLITHLLLRERDKTGRISLRDFYIRRTLRIFPPCYAFIGVVALLTAMKIYAVSGGAFLNAITYTWNFNNHDNLWIFGHMWSLGLEEQFYLLWPAFVAHFSRRTSMRVVAILFCLAPICRVAAALAIPTVQKRIHLSLPLLPDYFLVGCFIALASGSPLYVKAVRAVSKPAVVVSAAACLFLAAPYLNSRSPIYRPVVGYTAEALCIGIVLMFVVGRPQTWVGRFLNAGAVRHIGVISYSLYLWQQMFSGPYTAAVGSFPASVLAIAICAEASYWFIERPSFALRTRLLKRAVGRSAEGRSGDASDSRISVNAVDVA